jgi:hypothetical protein
MRYNIKGVADKAAPYFLPFVSLLLYGTMAGEEVNKAVRCLQCTVILLFTMTGLCGM